MTSFDLIVTAHFKTGQLPGVFYTSWHGHRASRRCFGTRTSGVMNAPRNPDGRAPFPARRDTIRPQEFPESRCTGHTLSPRYNDL